MNTSQQTADELVTSQFACRLFVFFKYNFKNQLKDDSGSSTFKN